MKIAAIIQARTSSTRLPGKAMKELQGKPMLEHIIDFLKYSKELDEIIIATTTLPEEEKIIELAKKLNVKYFCGSSQDVLDRYYQCAKFFKCDVIVRITSDNPLIDPRIVDKAIRVFKESDSDYVSNMINQTYPLGYLVEVISFKILEQNHQNQKDSHTREHVVTHIRNNPNLYKIKEIFAPKELARPEWRLTIDYAEDFKLISEIFSKLYKPNSYIPYEMVVEFLDKNKHLLKINEFYNM